MEIAKIASKFSIFCTSGNQCITIYMSPCISFISVCVILQFSLAFSSDMCLLILAHAVLLLFWHRFGVSVVSAKIIFMFVIILIWCRYPFSLVNTENL